MSDYRCREHPDEPVTWRGTGCRLCAGEHSPSPPRRRSWRAFDGELPDWTTTTERTTP